jgi:hemerythrin
MAVEWKDEYSTGEPEIDKQHKVIFKYLADLELHMKEGIDARYVGNLLENIGLFTRSHFCYEEICMRRSKCPIAAKNKEHHTKLLASYTHFCERFEHEGASDDLVQKLHAFLESWLVNHILKIDTHLKACINN